MTIYRRLNQAGEGGNFTTWWLIKTMLDAGWTVLASGSGTGGLYDSSNVFDLAQTPKNGNSLDPNGVGIGSEPWGYRNCWVLFEDPSGNRQYVFQRNNSAGWGYDSTWYFSYSPSGVFGVGQTAGVDWDEDTAPTASDIVSLYNAGSQIWWNDTPTLTHVAADDTPSPNGEYGVLCLEIRPTNVLSGYFVIDDLRNAPSTHPHALTNYCAPQTNRLDDGYYHAQASSPYSPGTISDFGGDGQSYFYNAPHCLWYGGSFQCLPANGGVGVDGKERAAPIVAGFVGREGYIGTSRWFRDPSVSRGYPNTGNSLQYLFVNDLLIVDLWDGVTTPATV